MAAIPSAAAKIFRVGIISGSNRTPRGGPQIADFVFKTISAHQSSNAATAAAALTPPGTSIAFDHIDIGDLALPFFDEPGVPSRIHSADGYVHEHSRAWSRRVSALDAFVFVTPQYNWGIPAGLKNAIDYLFNEWKGKPAVIVSYGGHGGGQAAAALKVVLGGGIGMRVVEKMVALTYPSREFLVQMVGAKPLGLEAEVDKEDGVWAKERGEITEAWDHLVGLLTEGQQVLE